MSIEAPESAHPKIARIIAYWREIAPASGLLPGRQHFDPNDVREALPHLWLIDVRTGSPYRYHYRLVGSAIVDSGSPVRPGLVLSSTNSATALYDAVVTERRLDWRRGAPTLFPHSKEVKELERVVLRFARDGHSVDLLVGMTIFYWADGRAY